jgi:8-oxo-dGTP pyrophosphatase MutT (NUDIX family)
MDKIAINASDIMGVAAPISNAAKNVWQLLPQKDPEDFSDRVGAYVSAEDELRKQKKEKKQDFWKRLLRNTGVGAGLGGALAATKAVPVVRGFSPEAAAVGAGLGALGSGGLTAAREIFQAPLQARAEKTINEADPSVSYVARNPKTREMAKEWESAQWSPYAGAEIGGLVGGLGTLGGAWALGAKPTAGQSWGLGAGGLAAGAVLGHLLGKWHKSRKQQAFLEHTQRELENMKSPKAQEAVVEAQMEQSPELQKAAEEAIKLAVSMHGQGGWPVCSTNAGLLRGRGGKVDQYAARKGGLVKLNEAHLDMAIDRLLGRESFAELCLDLEKMADDAQSVQNSDPKGDGPTDPVWAAEQAKGGAIVPVDVNKAPEGATEPSPATEATTDAVKTADESKPYRDRVEAFALDEDGTLYGGKYEGDKTFGSFGGGIEDGEDPLTAAAREFKEESGHDLVDHKLLDVKPLLADWKPPYESPQQAERAKKYRGSRTIFVGGKLKKSTDPAVVGTSCLKEIRNYTPEEVHASLDGAPEGFAKVRAAARKEAITKLLGLSKTAEEAPKLRRRCEVIVSNGKGILAIKKRGYLLMPGGGIKEGEDPADAVKRETSEEAGRKLKYLASARGSKSIDTLFDPKNIISPGHIGESTRFFTAKDAGEDGTTHKDREAFEFIPFDEAIEHLVRCMKRDDADWALANNAERLFQITKARDEADGTREEIDGAEHAYETEEAVKVADVAQYIPKSDVVYFTPSGKIAVKPGKLRRYDFPSEIASATDVPYETPITHLPETGVPEPGAHGYKYHIRTAEGELPEGFVEEDPTNVLNNLYASLGNPKNKAYSSLDRARARAILRLMKKRSKPVEAV